MSEEYQKITIPEYLKYQKLKQENERLQEALKFYLEACNNCNSQLFHGDHPTNYVARKALEKSE